jgi:hypothetical protein
MLIRHQSVFFGCDDECRCTYFFNLILQLKFTRFKISPTFDGVLNHVECHFYYDFWDVNSVFSDLDC